MQRGAQCGVQRGAQWRGACARGLRIPGGDSSGDSSSAGEIAPLAVRWLSPPVRETRSSAGLTLQVQVVGAGVRARAGVRVRAGVRGRVRGRGRGKG